MVISIIIPVFNLEGYISKCLKSIKRQNFSQKKFEVIIINDNSKDKSLKIIKKFNNQFKNFSIINNKNNIGPGPSRNRGILYAKGKYIMFLDGDDFLKKNALKILEKSLNNKNYDFIGYNFDKIASKRKIKRKCRKDFKFITKNVNKRIKNFLNGEIDGSVIFTIVRKKFLITKNIYFLKGLHEDIFFMFKIYFFAKKFQFLKKSLYQKQVRKNSIVNVLNKKRVNDFFNQPILIKNFLLKRNFHFKKLNKFYIRGVIGYVGGILAQNFYLKNSRMKKDIYEIIHKFSFKMLNKEIRPDQSKLDKIVNLFLKTVKNKKKNRDIFKIYEKKAIKLI